MYTQEWSNIFYETFLSSEKIHYNLTNKQAVIYLYWRKTKVVTTTFAQLPPFNQSQALFIANQNLREGLILLFILNISKISFYTTAEKIQGNLFCRGIRKSAIISSLYISWCLSFIPTVVKQINMTLIIIRICKTKQDG